MPLSAGRAGLTLAIASAATLAAPPARAASYSTGTFTKVTTGAPVTQVVPHGLGEVPKALILWTEGKTNGNVSADSIAALGASDGTTSRSIATASQGASSPSHASRRMAAKAITIVRWGQALLAEADLQSRDSINFTLAWTQNDAVPYLVHFIAIGGAEVSAKVLGWTMRSGSKGLQPVTGIGFRPTLVLHAHVGAGFTTAPPSSGAGGCLGLGAMDDAGNQWTTTFYTGDNASPADAQRYQTTASTLAGITSTQTVAKEAAFASMDADGFTVNWTTIDGAASQVFSLALGGVPARAGSFAKTGAPAPALQAVSGIPFRPGLVVFASFQDLQRATVVGHSRFAFGAAARNAAAASATTDRDAVSPTQVFGADRAGDAFLKADNGAGTIDAEATLGGFDPNGFTLSWNPNDAAFTEVLFVALRGKRRIWIAE